MPEDLPDRLTWIYVGVLVGLAISYWINAPARRIAAATPQLPPIELGCLACKVQARELEAYGHSHVPEARRRKRWLI
jgi:hypothetical protein